MKLQEQRNTVCGDTWSDVFFRGSLGSFQKSRTVRCKYCDAVVDDIVTHKMEMHPEIREKTKVRICPICNYRGHQLTTFIYHMMVEHNDTSHGIVQIYKCNSCDFQSCFQGAIQRHTRDVHGKSSMCDLLPIILVICSFFLFFSLKNFLIAS